jgi:hypothetical protein
MKTTRSTVRQVTAKQMANWDLVEATRNYDKAARDLEATKKLVAQDPSWSNLLQPARELEWATYAALAKAKSMARQFEA